MLRFTFYDDDQHDLCDLCRKSATGKEIVLMQASGRNWRAPDLIMVHTSCLVKKLDKHAKAKKEAV